MTENNPLNKWLIPVGKPLQSNHVVFQEMSGIEGVSAKTVGGMDYMTDGSVERWEMVDGIRTVVEIWR